MAIEVSEDRQGVACKLQECCVEIKVNEEAVRGNMYKVPYHNSWEFIITISTKYRLLT